MGGRPQLAGGRFRALEGALRGWALRARVQAWAPLWREGAGRGPSVPRAPGGLEHWLSVLARGD
eukprot:9426287-Lingulodinium_polyedra.AAC.1